MPAHNPWLSGANLYQKKMRESLIRGDASREAYRPPSEFVNARSEHLSVSANRRFCFQKSPVIAPRIKPAPIISLTFPHRTQAGSQARSGSFFL